MRIDSPLMTNLQATGSLSGSFEGDVLLKSIDFIEGSDKTLISGSTGSGGGTLGQVGPGTPYDTTTSASSFTINGDAGADYSGILSLKKGAAEEFLVYETQNIVALQASSNNNIWFIPNGDTSAAVKIDTNGHVVPASVNQDLGSSTTPWRDLYLSGNSLLLGNAKVTSDGSGNVTVSDASDNPVAISVSSLTVGDGSGGTVQLSVSGGALVTEDPANPGVQAVGEYTGSFTGAGIFDSISLGGTAISATATEINHLGTVTSDVQTQINTKASIVQLDASSSALQSNIDGVASAATSALNASSSTLQSNIDAKASIAQLDASSSTLQANIDTNATAITALEGTDIGITLTGDVTGTGTITNLGSVSFVTTVADDSHNHIIGNVDGLQDALDLKAPLASPALTGTPTAPTTLTTNDSTQIATTAFVQDRIQEVVASAPAALDTLNELAAAIGDDANFAGTVTTSLGEKLVKASNLSDLTDAAAARTNLGVDTKANTWTGVSGDISITSAGVATVADDSHSHIIGNVDGLQTALDGKLATTHDFDITLTGDVTGTGTVTNMGNVSFVTTVADDSHNHTIANVDGLQTALDSKQAAGTYNTIIGTDTDLDTSGAEVVDQINVTDGVIQSMSKRTLTLANLGYTGATDANNITNNNQLTNGAGYTTYSANQTLNNNSNVHFEGLMIGQTTGATANTIRCVGDIVAYYSDDRLKNRIGNLEDALSKVNSLNGFTYTPNEAALELGVDQDEVRVGVSAQEVQSVLPEAVKDAPVENTEGYLTVQYEKIVPLLIEAIKELSAKVEQLENK